MKVYAVEVSGACNLEGTCTWCPMNQRPRLRKRGLMSEDTVTRSLNWVKTLDKVDALALHAFGEPLLHPEFDVIAARFAELVPITMSTNAVLLDEKWADRLAKIEWAWISLSPWDVKAADRARRLLMERNVTLMFPRGVTHNFAGTAQGPKYKMGKCPFLEEEKIVIRWDGTIVTCCITDREEDSIGDVSMEPGSVKTRPYSLCETCHHGV